MISNFRNVAVAAGATKRIAIKHTVFVLAFIVTTSAANAAVDLIKVPALCGTRVEVLSTLSARMPNPEEIGQGGDSSGTSIATLLSGNGYWALLATMSPEQVCVVASGYNWIAADRQAAF